MKRIALAAVISTIVSLNLFSKVWQVSILKGNAYVLNSLNEERKLKPNALIESSTQIRISTGSELMFKNGSEEFRFNLPGTFTIDEMYDRNNSIKKNKAIIVNHNKKISSTIAGKVDKTSKGSATASQRASDIKEDLEWEE